MAPYKNYKKAARKAGSNLVTAGMKKLRHDTRHRYGDWSKLNYQKIVDDVLHLKSIVNAEKHIYNHGGDGTFAMKSGTGQAAYVVNISPNLVQGVGSEGYRIGDKVKMYSFQLRTLVKQQASLETATKYKIYLVRQPTSHHDLSQTSNLHRFLTNDPFNGTVNTMSLRNSLGANYKSFRVIGTTTGYVEREQVAGQSTQDQRNIFSKCNFRVQWATGMTGVSNIDQNPIYMIVVADNGNLAVQYGGLDINWSMTWRYYDN